MALLSRRFEEVHVTSDFTVGTPPIQIRRIPLSRQVQSELDFARFTEAGLADSIPRSVETNGTTESSFLERGDPLPDEVRLPPTIVEFTTELDAFIALQELGTLVARKRGINTTNFLNGLMELYSIPPSEQELESGCHGETNKVTYAKSLNCTVCSSESPLTPERASRQACSQPQHESAQIQRRHFSFEPGDDHISAMEDLARLHTTELSSSSEEEELCSDGPAISLRFKSRLDTDLQKPSMIPSPISRPVRDEVRREGSDSSVRTGNRKVEDTRRESSSSVLTAFRHSSSGSVRPVPQSRSGSMNTLRRDENRQANSINGLGGAHNTAAVAAARAVEQADGSVVKSDTVRSIGKTAPATLSTRTSRHSEKAHRQTALPQQRF